MARAAGGGGQRRAAASILCGGDPRGPPRPRHARRPPGPSARRRGRGTPAEGWPGRAGGKRRRGRRGMAAPLPRAQNMAPSSLPSLCVSAPVPWRTRSAIAAGGRRAGGGGGRRVGAGDWGEGGERPARFQRPPEPRRSGQSPTEDPRRQPAEFKAPRAAALAAAAAKKSSPELRPRPPELLAAPPPLALFSRSRLPSAMLQPGGSGANGSRPHGPAPSDGAARHRTARRGPARTAPARPPRRLLRRGALSRLRRARRGAARHGAARHGAARAPRPPALTSAAFRPRAPLLPVLPARPPRSPRPRRPRSGPRPGRGSSVRKGPPGAAPRLCVPAPGRRCPAAPRPGGGGGEARRAAPAACPAARAPGRPGGPRRLLTRVRVGTQPSLGPQPQRRPPGRSPRPQRCLGPCVAQCTAMAVRAGSIRSLLTLSALVTLLSTQPRPHWLPPSQPPRRLARALPLS